jgi:hypothetical protein
VALRPRLWPGVPLSCSAFEARLHCDAVVLKSRASPLVRYPQGLEKMTR